MRINEETREHIAKCYSLMKEYIQDPDCEFEERFDKLSNEIEKERPFVPESIFAKIERFVEDRLYITCIIEDELEELGEDKYRINKDGSISFINDESAIQFVKIFFKKTQKLNTELEIFTSKELSPYL